MPRTLRTAGLTALGVLALALALALGVGHLVPGDRLPAPGAQAADDGAGVATSSSRVARTEGCGRGAVPDPPTWMGGSGRLDVTLPSRFPHGPRTFAGSLFHPLVPPPAGDRLPVVLLQHGTGGDRCSLEWLARAVAGSGRLALTWTAPGGRDLGGHDSYLNAVRATASAYPWLRSTGNPLRAVTDPRRVVLGGSSLGSMSSSYLQGTALTPGTRALVALDNLRRWQLGDPGGAAWECGRPREGEVRPRVPALGFAMDAPCKTGGSPRYRELKLSGLKHWRAAGQPALVLALRGFEHTDFAVTGSDAQRRLVWHYVDAWIARWTEPDSRADATRRLLAPRVLGSRTTDLLSRRYASGAHLAGVDTDDLAAALRR